MDKDSKKVLVLLAFDLIGAGGLIILFGFNIYTLIGICFVILVCTVAANKL